MIDLVVSAIAAAALYKPFGVGGIVAGTGIGTSAAVFAQAYILRRKFGGLELGRLLSTTIRISIASAALAAVGWVVWDVLDSALGAQHAGADHLAGDAAWSLGGVAYLGGGLDAADRRARADPPPAAPARRCRRCSGRADICWAPSS